MKKSRIIIAIIIAICICALLLLGVKYYKNHKSNNVVSNDIYSLAYDNSWKIKTKKDNYVLLVHDKNSYLSFEITDLKNENKYSTIEDLKEEIIYNISKNNKNYNLIYEEDATYFKNKYPGYKILYETKDKQVMVNFYKVGTKLVTVIYEASNELFDILLDSVLNTIYNFDLKTETFDLNSEVSITTDTINYLTNSSLDALITNTKEYEIAANNYLVTYTIPDCFKLNKLDRTLQLFSLQDDKYTINIRASIQTKNIYEYLNKDISGNVYSNYSYYQKGEGYSDFNEQLGKLEEDTYSYIYRNSYLYSSKINENIELIYGLNNNHILVIKIDSRNINLTKKLIDTIKIKGINNYASYVNVIKKDNNLIAKLERFTDYNSNMVDTITITLPDKYTEIDKGQNSYVERYFNLGYNEDIGNSNYTIHYDFTNLSIDQVIKNYNDIYISNQDDKNKDLTYVKDIVINDKTFKLYEGGYTTVSGVMFSNNNRYRYYVNKQVLFYQYDDEKLFYIDISGNNKEITEELIKEVSMFEIGQEEWR